MQFDVNAPVLFILVGVVIAAVLAQSVYFLVKALRRAKQLAMDLTKIKKTIKTAALFTIAPAVAIVISVIALSKDLGLALPWLRLSVVGSMSYETIAASNAESAMGLTFGQVTSLTAVQYVTILLVMTISIMVGIWLVPVVAKKMQSGMISIGSSEIALHRILLPLLESFRQRYPGIRLRIYNSNTKQAVSVLKDRLVDFSLVTPPIDSKHGFERTDLTTFREVPICGKAYADLTRSPLSLAQLVTYPLISLCKGTSTHQLYTDWFHKHGLTFTPDIEAATADQILPMVRANLGIGFIPEYAAEDAARNGEVSILHLLESPPERTICLLKRTDMPLSVAARELERMLLALPNDRGI